MKILTLFLLLISFPLIGQTSINTATFNNYNANYKEVTKKLSKQPIDSSRIQLEKLVLGLEDLQKKNSGFNNDQIIALNNLYGKTVVFLCGSIYVPLGEYELVKKYDAILIKIAPIDSFWLGRMQSIMSWLYSVKNNQISSLISLKKSLDYFNKSTHKNKSFRKAQVLNGLIDSFINYGMTPKAKELLPVLEFELSLIDKKKIRHTTLLDLEILKIKLLLAEKKNEEALKKLNTINLDKIKKPEILYDYYFRIRNSYAYLEKYELYLKYHKKMINLPVHKTVPDYKMHENLSFLSYYLNINDKKNAAKYFNLYQKTPNTNEAQMPNIQMVLSKYYKKTENYKLAFKHQERIYFLEDSIYKDKIELSNKLNTYELLHEKDLIELKSDNIVKQKAIEYEKQKSIFIITLISLLFICLFLIYFNIRKKKLHKTSLELLKTKEILSYKNNFLENISHEMRTPITVIIGYLSLIKTKTLDAKKTLQYSSAAIRNSEQLIASLNNFLKISQLEHKKEAHKIISSKNAYAFFVDIVNSFAPSASLKNIKLYFSSNIKKNTAITYQYEALQKIIENLISNALKYSDSKTSIYITCTMDAEQIVLTVKDEGIGIAKEDQDKIFDKFYQSEQHAVTGGFGIGLSLVNELVKSLQGTIKLTSKQNLGSVFTIALPHHLENSNLLIESKQQEFTLLTIEDNITKITNNNYPKALIVDDNLEMIGYYKELFSSSLDCFFAFNGKEALELIEKQEIDIIISDYRMPILDGIDFKTLLNTDDLYKNIPFLLVTAVTTLDIVNEPKITIGVDDYIVKPFDKDELLTRIRTLLENTIQRKNLFGAQKDEIKLKSHHTDLIQKMKSIIIENLNNPDSSIKTLAQECGYEQKQLNRIVQSKTGMSVIQVIIEIRLLKAYDFILNNTYATLNELMYAVGFNSRPYFNKKFYERFGIKPGKLKKKYN